MRVLFFATALLATAAVAHTPPKRPVDAPPAATAAFDARADWCMRYAAWFVARVPMASVLPPDVRPTQRFEDELAYCKLDPQQYERDTREKLAATLRR